MSTYRKGSQESKKGEKRHETGSRRRATRKGGLEGRERNVARKARG